jgi:ornithine carbamoyltransferase
MIRHFVNLADFSGDQLDAMLSRAIAEKADYLAGVLPPTLSRKTLALIFEKPSLRTRVSFETAMAHLGGSAVYLTQADIGLGTREPVKDVARVLGRMCDGIAARTFRHESIVELAAYSDAPVINALSDYSHPCQAMADLMTMREHFGEIAGRKLAFIGDGNNVARSLATACAKLGLRFTLACPVGYELEEAFVAPLGATVAMTNEPAKAVVDADVVYTDTWVSMGQEAEKDARASDFLGFQIDEALMAKAPPSAVVMHCLPAYRGCEISEAVFEAHAGTIFAEACNRLHFQRTLLNLLIGEGGIA